MPKMVSEITQGSTFEFSSEDQNTSAQDVRVFRIIKSSPTEYIDLPVACDAHIGDEHPRNPGLFCTNFSGAYEGESRMVILATFNYRTTPSQAASGGGQDPNSQEPQLRPANWYTTSSLIEVPAQMWEFSSKFPGGANPDSAAEVDPPTATINPAGDLYEVITKPTAIVTIHIEQWEPSDPTRHNLHAGKTNNKTETLGTLSMPRRTIMFRGVQSRPATESFGGLLSRGWQCSYEFLYKPNIATYHWSTGGNAVGVATNQIGWDVLQPLSGFNVKAFNPDGAAAEKDPFGQPLKSDEDTGEIKVPLALPDKPAVAVGGKVRAQVKIGLKGGYTGQRPSAQPIPLNPDGTPRAETANPKVVVFRYKVTEEIDFQQTFNLRLQ
jgi:ribulose bisphosphate carboxylase small subunit